ncbi:helix-turn-helix transcriptional regulator [Streptomyces sp. NPDC003691]
MPPVFAHGRLRLYLLTLLDEAPRHGYEVIRLLEERFHGLYAPSAGTVYPRLAKLAAEGLVTRVTEGGRKVYSITEAGRAELAGRGGELAGLEQEIREAVAELAAEIRDGVRVAAGRLRGGIRAASVRARPVPPDADDRGDRTERAREAQQAREARKARSTRENRETPPTQEDREAQASQETREARELDRLLDRFRDDVRHAARDHGVTESQLGEARHRLTATAARLTALLGENPMTPDRTGP